ncbi:MAG TPA: histidine kinase dimerization/phospho-acceptor domain-containing protein, partial [Terriglobales bacterium]|nr:histidine kinase dimerization/phospho-acceptor domain-containing protein [Terriglobales bacterium]
MSKLSIGLRLTLWYVAIFALGQFAFGMGMWLVLRHHLISIVDDSLRDQTGDLRSFLETQKKSADLAKFREEVTETYSQEHAGEYLVVFTSAGDAVYVSDILKTNAALEKSTLPGAGSGKVNFEDRVFQGKSIRFLRSSIETHGFTFIVQMGTPMKAEWETLHTFRNYLLWLAPLVLLTSAAGGYWLSRRALAPVDALARTARNIDGHNLRSRLEKLNTGDELQRLSDTLNEMLERIEKAFLRTTQFTADASHELRTPIALMRTEAEIALRRSRDGDAYREALQHILRETERTAALIEDLLALARTDSGSELLTLRPIELTGLLQDCGAEWKRVPAAMDHQISLRSLEAGEVWVLADESGLRRVLAVLLDNALKYTPIPGQIAVFLERKGQRAVLSVVDNGIGIPAIERTKIFERFYRVDT